MKKILGNTFLKVMVGLLTVALLVGFVYNTAIAVLFTVESPKQITQTVIHMAMDDEIWAAKEYYDLYQMKEEGKSLGTWGSERIKELEQQFNPENTNLRYLVQIGGKTVFSNYKDEPFLASDYLYTEEQYSLEEFEKQFHGELDKDDFRTETSYRYDSDPHADDWQEDIDGAGNSVYSNDAVPRNAPLVEQEATPMPMPTPSPTPVPREEIITVYVPISTRVFVLEDLAVEDRYAEIAHWCEAYLAADVNECISQAVIFGISALICIVFLLCAAGHRANSDEIELRAIERLPWDLWLTGVIGVGVLLGLGACLFGSGLRYVLSENFEMLPLLVKGALAYCALCLGAFVWVLVSLATRVKVRGWWKNAFLWKVCVYGWKICKKVFVWLYGVLKRFGHSAGGIVKQIPLVWKAVVLFGIVAAIQLACAMAWDGGINFFGWLLGVVLYVGIVVVCVHLKRLQIAARQIADGDLDYCVDTKGMYFDIKEHAENLNRISDGLSRSVDEKLRSERMKTELITNVSHDLKTPLTSIVNYVDLLKKEELTGTAAEYVEVLDRQSARLKKLTEDLVEASKASTGNLNVTLERVNLAELLNQAKAEYANRLEEKGLTTIVYAPDTPVEVRADGKYLWRILDNLLGNVCKYAMPNTRVYLDVRTENHQAILSVKNISKDCLNVSAEELMERFVRGDSSRNTEGSGLGLSIAQSLAKLMGGTLQITVDGDLFKAEVTLPLAE